MKDIGCARRSKRRYRVVDLRIIDSKTLEGHDFAIDTDIPSKAYTLIPTQCAGLCSSLQSDPNYVPGVDLTVRDRELLHFSKAYHRKYDHEGCHD